MYARDRAGLIIIRVWEPTGTARQICARITEVDDVAGGTGGGRETAVVSGREAIIAHVDAWLRAFDDRPPRRMR